MKTNESGSGSIPKDSQAIKVCDLKELIEMMGGKRHLIKGIMDSFLVQMREELKGINEAVSKTDYAIIKRFSHSMRSTVSIMGISALAIVLKEMEDLGTMATGIEKIKEHNKKLNVICSQAIDEIEKEILKYA